jgi:hypothetical protein
MSSFGFTTLPPGGRRASERFGFVLTLALASTAGLGVHAVTLALVRHWI